MNDVGAIDSTRSKHGALAGMVVCLILVQLVCALLFLFDVVAEYPGVGYMDWHFTREALATLALFIGIAFEAYWLRSLLRRNSSLERSVVKASSVLHEIVEAHFNQWKLTPSERDVGFLLVKGFSISEIAQVRGTAEGTVKAHLNAIYRKSNSRTRAELMSTIMDTLVERPLLTTGTISN